LIVLALFFCCVVAPDATNALYIRVANFLMF
jgi:hypothetical protein